MKKKLHCKGGTIFILGTSTNIDADLLKRKIQTSSDIFLVELHRVGLLPNFC